MASVGRSPSTSLARRSDVGSRKAATHRRLVLGVDGGQTGTRAVVVDDSGAILAFAQAGTSKDLGQFQRAVHDAVSASQAKGAIDNVVLGLSGAGLPPEVLRPFIDVARSESGSSSITIEGDAYTCLMGASGGAPGVIVIAGGGSIAFGVDEDGRRFRSGGWGYRIGDEGSAHDIGRRLLKLALRRSDGRDSGDQRLCQEVMTHFGVASMREVGRLVAQSNDDFPPFARLAPLAVRAASQGDDAAKRILLSAAHELVELAVAVAKAMDDDRPSVYRVGGVFNDREFMLQFDAEARRRLPGASINDPKYPPVIGAAIVALGQTVRFREDQVQAVRDAAASVEVA